jgi:hypothetical protein
MEFFVWLVCVVTAATVAIARSIDDDHDDDHGHLIHS